jgi:hypothetical protein
VWQCAKFYEVDPYLKERNNKFNKRHWQNLQLLHNAVSTSYRWIILENLKVNNGSVDWKKAGLALTWVHPRSRKIWQYWWQVPWERYSEAHELSLPVHRTVFIIHSSMFRQRIGSENWCVLDSYMENLQHSCTLKLSCALLQNVFVI